MAQKILEQQKSKISQKRSDDSPCSFQRFVARRTCDYLLTFHGITTIMLRHGIQKCLG